MRINHPTCRICIKKFLTLSADSVAARAFAATRVSVIFSDCKPAVGHKVPEGLRRPRRRGLRKRAGLRPDLCSRPKHGATVTAAIMLDMSGAGGLMGYGFLWSLIHSKGFHLILPWSLIVPGELFLRLGNSGNVRTFVPVVDLPACPPRTKRIRPSITLQRCDQCIG